MVLIDMIFSWHPIVIACSEMNSLGRASRRASGRADTETRIPFNLAAKKLIFLMQHYLRNEVSAEIAK